MTHAPPGGLPPASTAPSGALASLRARPWLAAGLTGLYLLLLAAAWSGGWSPAHQAPQATLAGVELALSLLLGSTLVALSVIDVATFRLPDVLTLPLVVAGLLGTWAIGLADPLWHAAAAAGGFLGLFGVNEAYRALRGRSGLGGGDAKLAAAGGAWVGVDGLLAMLLWGCLLALAGVALAHLAGHRLRAEDRIPFGPFLALGLWLAWLLLRPA